jgi:uncharacterized membrane protein YbhN (UPF0104 family)
MANTVLRHLTHLPAAAAHILCAGCVGADLWSRSLRMQLMTHAAGSSLSFRHALALTSFGDAAAAVTPLRAGGEFARVVGARAAGVRLPVIAAVLSIETLVVYGLAAIVGAWLAAAYGGEWVALVRPQRGAPSVRAISVAAVVTLLLLGLAAATPAVRMWLARAARGARTAFTAARRITWGALWMCLALSVVSLVARIAILPLLALTLPGSPPVGVLTLISFTLVHGQIAMPTPAGAGPIEMAFLMGGTGITQGAVRLLGWWRVYATLIPVVVGFLLGAIVYGRSVVRALPFIKRNRREGAFGN